MKLIFVPNEIDVIWGAQILILRNLTRAGQHFVLFLFEIDGSVFPKRIRATLMIPKNSQALSGVYSFEYYTQTNEFQDWQIPENLDVSVTSEIERFVTQVFQEFPLITIIEFIGTLQNAPEHIMHMDTGGDIHVTEIQADIDILE